MTVLVLGAWRDLTAARDDLSGVQEGLAAAVRGDALQADQRADLIRRLDVASRALAGSERQLSASRPLAILRAVPPIGAMRRGILALLADATHAAATARDLVAGIDGHLDGALVEGGAAPLPALGSVRADLTEARSELAPLVRGTGGLWGPVARQRRRFDEAIRSFTDQLEAARDGVAATSTFLGSEGERRYLLALENNAEMRAQGAVLSYGVLRFDGGRFTLERSGSIGELTLDKPAPTPLPAGTAAVFGPLAPTQTWQSANASADFALSGGVMADMFRQATGAPVDGVVAVDVVGVAALLEAAGPVSVPGIAEPVTAENVARIVLHDQYEGLPPLVDGTDRRDRLAELTGDVVDRLRAGAFDPIVLGRLLGTAAAGGHLQLWSSHDAEQRTFAASGLSGSPVPNSGAQNATGDRTFHVAVENRTATKLDYFIHPTVLQRVRITDAGDALVTVTVRIENRAPVGAAPSYQLGPDRFTAAPGDYVGWVLLWSPAGADAPGAVPESGLQVSQRVVAVRAGSTAEVTFGTVRIKNALRHGRLELRFVPQPRLDPMGLQVVVSADRWRIEGAREQSEALDRTRSMGWKVTE